MKTIRNFLLALLVVGMLPASSAWGTVVWDLNPSNLNAPAGSSTQVYTSQGYQITASGFDNTGAIGTPHELFFKNQAQIGGATERGLGLVGTSSNELQITGDGTAANYIQLDLRSILKSALRQ